ncbi:BTB/POZ domain-containing protein 6-like [Ruditapes philippinarum]|uniref:BTB/POZ domain-containing protein 6-like n=1 Tax=Ruditapes philippinarum TaxID=129788 RepID=UPI00295AC616|nr:BTB/POZ domain-containing protein 6-like [Ruditapes philippinarum]
METSDWQMGRSLNGCLGELFHKKLWSDISFRCKDSDQLPQNSIQAHKIILASRSPVYQAMFYGPCADTNPEIELSDTDSNTFKLFLKYLYTDSTDLTEESVPAVMQIAHKYQVTSLLTYCSQYLISILRADNVCAVLELALFFEEKKLEDEAVKFIDDNGEKVLKSDGFYDLQQTTLEYLLKGDTFLAPEKYIVNAAIRWAKGKCKTLNLEETGPNIRKVLAGAFKYLRFPTLSAEEFSKLTYKQGLFSFEELEETISYITGNINAQPFHSVRQRRQRAVKCRPKHIRENFTGHLEFIHYVNVTTTVRVRSKDFLVLTGFSMSGLIKSPIVPDFINPKTMYTLGVSISKSQDGEDLIFPKMFYNNVETHKMQEFHLVQKVEMEKSTQLYLIFHIMSDPHCMVLIPEVKPSTVPFSPPEITDIGQDIGFRALEATYMDSWRFMDHILYESPSKR